MRLNQKKSKKKIPTHAASVGNGTKLVGKWISVCVWNRDTEMDKGEDERGDRESFSFGETPDWEGVECNPK